MQFKNGVLIVFATGNEGPQPESLDNFSAWSIVLGAATIDRNPGNNPGDPCSPSPYKITTI